MQWANALSTRPSLEAAVLEVVERTQQALSAPANFGLVFISTAFTSEYSRLMPLLQEHLNLPVLIGCSGGGIIGRDSAGQTQEVETNPALSLCLASMPEVNVQTFHIAEDDLPDLDSPPDAWIEQVGVSPESQPQFILLGAPMSSGISNLLQGLDFAYPGSVKVGGLASTDMMGNSGLFRDRTYYQSGTIGVALSGNLVLDTIVAQGCRPIGQPYRVAKGERNVLLELEDPDYPDETRSPLEVLQELFQTLSEEDRALAQNSLFIGVAQSSFKRQLEQGDFLIRNLLGVDPRVGAIAIGDRIRPGQRIQFHLRDAKTSAEDLTLLLERYTQNQTATQPAGALMFACMGRGEQLYEAANFDSQLFHQYVGATALSGFFCNGEIGPVEGTTFLHGYTSVFGICRQPYVG